MTKAQAFALRLADIAGAMGERVSPARLDTMAEAIATELSDDEFYQACRMVLLSEQKFPPPAKFIEYARGTARGFAEEACAKVFQAIRDFGYANSSGARAFLGEEIWKAVERMGGWVNLCTREGFNIAVFRAQFLKCMEETSKHIAREKGLLSLPVGQQILELSAAISERRALSKHVR